SLVLHPVLRGRPAAAREYPAVTSLRKAEESLAGSADKCHPKRVDLPRTQESVLRAHSSWQNLRSHRGSNRVAPPRERIFAPWPSSDQRVRYRPGFLPG